MPARGDHANGNDRTWLNTLQATCELASTIGLRLRFLESCVWGDKGGGMDGVGGGVGFDSTGGSVGFGVGRYNWACLLGRELM